MSKFNSTSNAFVSEILLNEKLQYFPRFLPVKLFDVEQRLSKGDRQRSLVGVL